LPSPACTIDIIDIQAPEILTYPSKDHPDDNRDNLFMGYTAAVDAWAMGILAHEILLRYAPFQSDTQADTTNKILSMDVDLPASISQEAREFIQMALSKV
jgi:serine/threonine protein kinase